VDTPIFESFEKSRIEPFSFRFSAKLESEKLDL
jgi:hypothetical protein